MILRRQAFEEGAGTVPHGGASGGEVKMALECLRKVDVGCVVVGLWGQNGAERVDMGTSTTQMGQMATQRRRQVMMMMTPAPAERTRCQLVGLRDRMIDCPSAAAIATETTEAGGSEISLHAADGSTSN